MYGDALFMFGIHAKFAQIKKSRFMGKKVVTHYYDDHWKRIECGTSVRIAVEKKRGAIELHTVYFDHTGTQCGTSKSTFSDGYLPKYTTIYYNQRGQKVGSSSSILYKNDSEHFRTTYKDDEGRIFADSKSYSAGSDYNETTYRVDARNKVLPMREELATISYGSFYQQPKPKRKTPLPMPTPRIYSPNHRYVHPLDYPSLYDSYSEFSKNPRAINAIFQPSVSLEETLLLLHNRASRSPTGPAAAVLRIFQITIKIEDRNNKDFLIHIFTDEKLFSKARLPIEVLRNTKIPIARRVSPDDDSCCCISGLASLFGRGS
ncbi:hypothetical protein Lmor_1639 [Legionella moravica]|uniref:Uncharacterized protein n=2 Tax=Legionella moravica TaxID=39962 RepID=A0A378JZH8_9GAMM|nr:hypothetical protein [Legionella moravica]KTD34242.1 hypothetical protein Lmor_1639 [Legionella moravica]STX62882.1 Uncharacterised protein [Legionella moravica]